MKDYGPGDIPAHRLPINDVRQVWSEERTQRAGLGVSKFTVYIGVCDCGKRFEGKDSDSVVRQFMQHVERIERGY